MSHRKVRFCANQAEGHRIDILTGLIALQFDDAWAKRINVEINGLVLPVLNRESFRANKAALGRNKDLADIEDLV